MDRSRLAIAALTAVLGGCSLAEDEAAPAPLAGWEPAPCELDARAYTIDRIRIPHSAAEARVLGFDLDGDRARVDNAGGMLLALLQVSHGDELSIEDHLAERLPSFDWQLVVQRCETAAHARVVLAGPDDVWVVPAVGTADGDRVRATAGIGAIDPALLFDLEDDARDGQWVSAVGLAADLHFEGDGSLRGRLGFAIAPDAIAGAATDSVGAALALPDLDLIALHRGREVWWPRHDHESDSVSFGLEVHAIPR